MTVPPDASAPPPPPPCRYGGVGGGGLCAVVGLVLAAASGRALHKRRSAAALQTRAPPLQWPIISSPSTRQPLLSLWRTERVGFDAHSGAAERVGAGRHLAEEHDAAYADELVQQ